MAAAEDNHRPEFDQVIQTIVDYALHYRCESKAALDTAYYCLLDSLGCGFLALNYPECRKLLGPIITGASYPNGILVPGTDYQLDPVQGAFNIGLLVRWLDFNDTWLSAEWGHPSDNLGAIWSLAQFVNQQRLNRGQSALRMTEVLQAMIKAYEIQGVLALSNAFNRVGFDHVILVKIASTAVAAQLLGLTREQALNAVSLAWVDGHSLRTYRHAPNTGSRKSWAAGDASARAVWLCLIAQRGEMGYPSALTAKTWGLNDVLMQGQDINLSRELGSYVIENILFKIAYPAEFHAQTAVEAALSLHPVIKTKAVSDIAKIHIATQEAALRIINKQGPLYNPADRDHCLQYMVAIALLFGELTAKHYEDAVANDPRIDKLREKIQVVENPQFSRDYLDPQMRSIGNSIQIEFIDGSKTDLVTVEYPIGHRNRRKAAIPLLIEKFVKNVKQWFPEPQAEKLIAAMLDKERIILSQINDITDLLIKK